MSIIFRRPARYVCGPFSKRTSGSAVANQSEKAAASLEEVVIPKYIPRGPTDILEALATTVGRDYTAPHYKYHDDPYLYPNSTHKKKVFALSQESGRKAARWIRDDNSKLFVLRELDPPTRMLIPYANADPVIEAFIPKTIYNEETNVSVNDLKTVINNHLITDAITIYQLLTQKKTETISDELKQELLELLCYYNNTEPSSNEWLEEKWFKDNGNTGQQKMKWKSNGLAMEIFISIAEKTPAAYCSVIQGMCKYHEAEGAYKLYNECLENKIPLNISTYNMLLSVAPNLKENIDMQWEYIIQLLNDMKTHELTPNIITLNTILNCLSSVESKQSKDYALEILSEFVNECKIEPSLATWYHIINIFHKEKGNKYNVLYTIVEKLEGKNFTIRDPKDVLFFSNAMQTCRYSLFDGNLAQKIHNLLLFGKNYDFIGDAYKETQYYRFYFSIMVRTASVESYLEMYNNLVPYIYTPDSHVMEETIRLIDINGTTEYFPLLWSHCIMFGHASRQGILQLLLESMVRNLPIESLKDPQKDNKQEIQKKADSLQASNLKSLESTESTPVEESFANIAWDIWNKTEEQNNTSKKISWTAPMLNDIIMLLTRASRIENAHTIVTHLLKSEGSLGVPSTPDTLMYFANAAVANHTPSYSVDALTYLLDCGFSEPKVAAKEILQNLLNRPDTDIDEMARQYANLKPNENTADSHVSKLLELMNNDVSSTTSKKSVSGENTSSSSSSSSDSDSSDEDDDLNDDNVKQSP